MKKTHLDVLKNGSEFIFLVKYMQKSHKNQICLVFLTIFV